MDISYRIKLARSEDLSDLKEVELEAAELFSEEDLPSALRSNIIDPNEIEKARREKRLWLVIEDRSNKIVGFALLTQEDNQIHIKEIDVHPQHGRKGLGTRLFKKIIYWAKDHGYQFITLTTFRHLSWNAPFYQKVGFRIGNCLRLTEIKEIFWKKFWAGVLLVMIWLRFRVSVT